MSAESNNATGSQSNGQLARHNNAVSSQSNGQLGRQRTRHMVTPDGRGIHITPARPERDPNRGVEGGSELRAFSERLVADAVAEVRLAALNSIADLQAALKASIDDKVSVANSQVLLGVTGATPYARRGKKGEAANGSPRGIGDDDSPKSVPEETVKSSPSTSFSTAPQGRTKSELPSSELETIVVKRQAISHGEAYSRARNLQRARIENLLTASTLETLDDATPLKRRALNLVASTIFNYAMCFVIFLNSVTIGYEIEMGLRNDTTSAGFLFIAEQIFLVIYIIELGLTFFAVGFRCLWGPGSGWIRFDLVLVVTGALTSWVAVPAMGLVEDPGASADADNDAPMINILQQVLIFRMLRILRLARALRILGYFETLAKFVDGMLSSAGTMVSALIVMALTVYIMSCIGAEVISKDPSLRSNPEVADLIESRFFSLPSISMTLMQFTTADSLSGFYVPIVDESPVLAIFFLLCFLFITVLLMNLVAAIVLEDALSRAKSDQERETQMLRHKLKTYRPHIEAVFDELDKSQDGHIQLAEVTAVTHTRKKLPKELAKVLQPDMLVDFFEYLDIDGSGSVSKDEFIEGVEHLSISTVPVEISQIIQLLRDGRHRMISLENDIHAVRALVHFLAQRQGFVMRNAEDGSQSRSITTADNMQFSI